MPPNRLPNYLALLGSCLEIAWVSGDNYAKLTIEQFMARFFTPISKGCIALVTGEKGWLEGFCTYGYFKGSEHLRLAIDASYTPPKEAWGAYPKDGEYLWVMDFICAEPSLTTDLLNQMIDLAGKGSTVHYWRIGPGENRPRLTRRVI